MLNFNDFTVLLKLKVMYPLLNSIFSETYKELQTLQEFSCLQTHFVMGYLVSSSRSQHVTVKGNKRVKTVYDYTFGARLKAF